MLLRADAAFALERRTERERAAIADALGHIQFKRVVDTYTDCAVTVRKKARARTAQREMLSLFEARKVVDRVVENVRARVRELT